jgi:hypothetical protein
LKILKTLALALAPEGPKNNTFLGVYRQGEFKNTKQIFLQKVLVKNYSQNKLTNISMSVFYRFFLFYRVFGCFSAMGVRRHFKKFDQKSKTDFLTIFFNHVFGRFSVRGVQVQKHDKKYRNIGGENLTPILCWPPTPPPTTGVTVFFGAAPCLLLPPCSLLLAAGGTAPPAVALVGPTS